MSSSSPMQLLFQNLAEKATRKVGTQENRMILAVPFDGGSRGGGADTKMGCRCDGWEINLLKRQKTKCTQNTGLPQ